MNSLRFLACIVDADPCPPGSVTSITLSDAVDFGALGINPTDILYVFSWGFSAVLALFLIGLGVAYAYGVIRRL